MRDQREMKEYQQKRRFCKILDKYRKEEIKCDFCDNTLETLHHKDENHANNKLDNLQPVCQKHHLAIPHSCDSTPEIALESPRGGVPGCYSPIPVKEYTLNCNISIISNVTVLNPSVNGEIYIGECTKKTLRLLSRIGYINLIRR